MSYVYDIYNNCLRAEKTEEERIVFMIGVIQIIKKWCENVQIYISKKERGFDNENIRNILYEDYVNFNNRKDDLTNFMKNVYVNKKI